MCTIQGNGTIINANNPRPAQNVSGFSCYIASRDPTVATLESRNASYYSAAMPAVTVPLACHHVIGWDVIWGFWNALVAQQDYDRLRVFMAFYGVDQAKSANLKKDISNARYQPPANFEAKLCWNPINIVRGPNDRTDDPSGASTASEKIDFQTAPAAMYGGRVAKLVAAGKQMCLYMNHPKSNGGSADVALQALRALNTSGSTEIMEWDESLWMVDKKTPSYSRLLDPRGGFAVVRPKWKLLKDRRK